MIISRKTKVDVAIDLLEQVQRDESWDAVRARSIGTDEEIIEGFVSNVELISKSLEPLRKVK